MTRGRKKLPKEVKIAEGNRSKVAKADLEPNAPKGLGTPSMPPGMDDEEQACWREVVGSLPVGLLTRADNSMLERMATAWARFRATKASIKATGTLVKSPSGPIRNPLWVILNAAQKEMHACSSELGLSPVSRARLAMAADGAEDPMAMLLGMEDDWDAPSTTRQ
jgi:P27 family predicted phage terminase small subunit